MYYLPVGFTHTHNLDTDKNVDTGVDTDVHFWSTSSFEDDRVASLLDVQTEAQSNKTLEAPTLILSPQLTNNVVSVVTVPV